MNIIKKAFIMTSTFDRRWNKLKLSDNDLQELEIFIMQNPDAGDVIPETGGAVKLRWSLSDKGKRGGIRVIYVDVVSKAHIHLLLCYSKNEQDDLSNEQKKQIIKLIKILKGE